MFDVEGWARLHRANRATSRRRYLASMLCIFGEGGEVFLYVQRHGDLCAAEKCEDYMTVASQAEMYALQSVRSGVDFMPGGADVSVDGT